MAEIRKYTPEETLDLIREIAQTKGDDFRLKVCRQDRPAGYQVTLMTLDKATLEHITFADSWVPKLFGGAGRMGFYVIYIYHADPKEITKVIGGGLIINVAGEPFETIDLGLLEQPDWMGPRQVYSCSDSILPRHNVKVPQMPQMMHSQIPQMNQVTPILSPSVPQVLSAAGGSVGHPNTTVPGTKTKEKELEISLQYEREARMKLEAEMRNQQFQRDQAELQRKFELQVKEIEQRAEEARRESDRKFQELIQAAQSKTPSPTEALSSLTQALQPIIAPLITSMQSSRQAEAQAARELAQAEREATKALLNQQNEMMKMALNKPKDDSIAQALQPMVSAMSAMSQLATQNMVAMMEMQNMNREEGEPHWVTVAKEGIKGLIAMSQMNAMKAASRPPVAYQGLPQPKQPPQINPQMNQPGNIPQGVAAQSSLQRPQPKQVEPEIQEEAQSANEEESFTVLDEIEDMIRNKEEPKEVAKKLLHNYRDPTLQAELANHQDNPLVLVQSRLNDWLEEDPVQNNAYIETVVQNVITMATESGMSFIN